MVFRKVVYITLIKIHKDIWRSSILSSSLSLQSVTLIVQYEVNSTGSDSDSTLPLCFSRQGFQLQENLRG